MWIDRRKPLLAAALLAALHAPASAAFDRNHAAAAPGPAGTGTVATAPARRAPEEPVAPIPTLAALQGWRPAIRGQVERQEPSLRERALREPPCRSAARPRWREGPASRTPRWRRKRNGWTRFTASTSS